MRLKIGSCYIHISSGNAYKILMLTNEKAKTNQSFKPTVVYDDKYGDVWSRPLDEFTVKFKAI